MNSEEYYAESIIRLCDEYFRMSAYDMYKSRVSPVALVAGVSEILRNYKLDQNTQGTEKLRSNILKLDFGSEATSHFPT